MGCIMPRRLHHMRHQTSSTGDLLSSSASCCCSAVIVVCYMRLSFSIVCFVATDEVAVPRTCGAC